MNQKMIDAIRTTGQLLLHSPTTNAHARDAQGYQVDLGDPDACRFCYTGATETVAAALKVSWACLDSACDSILIGPGYKLMPWDWDSTSDKQRKAWAQKLANFKG